MCPYLRKRGTCESRNAERGTRNGTRNGSKMRAARYHHRTSLAGPDPHGDYHRTRRASLFTGLVDWTGLTQKSVRCLFQCKTEAKHTSKVACRACFRVFPRVGRGQRSRAYLMSSSKMHFSQPWDDRGILFSVSMLQQKAGVRCLR